MSAVLGRHRTRLCVALLVLGALLGGLGLRRRADWAGQGRIVAQVAQTVPGAPPWSMVVEVPQRDTEYLLESTVTLRGSGGAERPTISPTLRLTGPDRHPADGDLQPLRYGRLRERGQRVDLATHAWFRPSLAGRYQVELLALNARPDTLAPAAWRLRLAEGAPRQPGGAATMTVGFVLAAMGLLGLMLGGGKSARA